MMRYGKAYVVNQIRIQAYEKAQKEVNQSSENPLATSLPYYIDTEDEMGFVEFAPVVLERLCQSTCLDFPEGEFAELLLHIKLNVEERMDLSIGYVFHFGLLFDNVDLFSEEEQRKYLREFASLFKTVPANCLVYSEFYNAYFKNEFFSGDSQRYKDFEQHMNYSYVFFTDLNNHSMEDFGPYFMGSYSQFAKAYTAFYREFIPIIQERKRGRRRAN